MKTTTNEATNILIFGDLMGRVDLVKGLFAKDLSNFDCLIYNGDMPDPTVFKAIRQTKVPEGFDASTDIEKELVNHPIPRDALQKATKEVIDICYLIEESKIPVFGVLGNADLKYYTKSAMWPFRLLHKSIIDVNGYHLVGYDGRPLYSFEQENRNENAFSEEDVENDLGALLSGLDNRKTILITHAPAYGVLDKVKDEMIGYAVGTYGVQARGGNIGSTGIGRAVERYKPFVHIFGHVHEDKGVVANDTVSINTGSTGEDEGLCIVTLHNNECEVEFVSMDELS